MLAANTEVWSPKYGHAVELENYHGLDLYVTAKVFRPGTAIRNPARGAVHTTITPYVLDKPHPLIQVELERDGLYLTVATTPDHPWPCQVVRLSGKKGDKTRGQCCIMLDRVPAEMLRPGDVIPPMPRSARISKDKAGGFWTVSRTWNAGEGEVVKINIDSCHSLREGQEINPTGICAGEGNIWLEVA